MTFAYACANVAPEAKAGKSTAFSGSLSIEHTDHDYGSHDRASSNPRSDGNSAMISATKSAFRPFSYLAFAALLWLLSASTAPAQQFLGNARQKCAGEVTVATPDTSMKIRQFEARSAEIGEPAVKWQCQDQPQVDIECPANTNKVLVDRSQGGSVFSIICLHR
jgi:hypothetical protein